MFVSGADSTYNQIIGRVVLERVREGGGGRDGKIILSETQKSESIIRNSEMLF